MMAAAAVEVRCVGAWNSQRSELSSAAGLGNHCLASKYRLRRKLSVRAEKARGVEDGKVLSNSRDNYFLLGRNNVGLILKAVQTGSIGGAQSIIQQMYNLKDIPIPLLDASYSVVNEIKKRMAFPWQEEDERNLGHPEEQKTISTIPPLDSHQLESPTSLNDQGARCVWPRSNDISSMRDNLSKRPESIMGVSELNNQLQRHGILESHTSFTQPTDSLSVRDVAYPRCPWPRKESKSAINSVSAAALDAPRCAWPRVPPRINSKSHFQEQVPDSAPKFAAKEGIRGVESSAATEVDGNSIAQSSSLRQEKTEDQLYAGPRCVWPKDRVAGKATVAKDQNDPDPAQRAAFPSDFPRRMLATSVGISLMNYLLVGQGASALAFPGDLLHSIDPFLSRKADLCAK